MVETLHAGWISYMNSACGAFFFQIEPDIGEIVSRYISSNLRLKIEFRGLLDIRNDLLFAGNPTIDKGSR